MLNYIYITVAISFIIDYAGVIETFKRFIHRMVNGKIEYIHFRLKPFDCALCMAFWITLIYSIYAGNGLILSIAIASLCGYSTTFISDALKLTYELFNKLLSKFYD